MIGVLVALAFMAAMTAVSTLLCCALARTFALWKPMAVTSGVTVCVTLLALHALTWAGG